VLQPGLERLTPAASCSGRGKSLKHPVGFGHANCALAHSLLVVATVAQSEHECHIDLGCVRERTSAACMLKHSARI
jgi:hypothetical protein